MKFPYRKYANLIWKPVIPVLFKFGDHAIEYHTLIDTGADVSIIHAEFGEALGIDIKSGNKMGIAGINGKTIGYTHPVELIIGGNSFGTVPVNFSYDFAPQAFGILGHEELFGKMRLIFEYAKKELEVIPKEYRK